MSLRLPTPRSPDKAGPDTAPFLPGRLARTDRVRTAQCRCAGYAARHGGRHPANGHGVCHTGALAPWLGALHVRVIPAWPASERRRRGPARWRAVQKRRAPPATRMRPLEDSRAGSVRVRATPEVPGRLPTRPGGRGPARHARCVASRADRASVCGAGNKYIKRARHRLPHFRLHIVHSCRSAELHRGSISSSPRP